MLFYYVLLAIVLVIQGIVIVDKRYQKLFVGLLILGISFLASIRDGVGTDFESYQLIFDLAPTLPELFNTSALIDPLFWALCSVIKTLGGGAPVMFFCAALITNYFLYRASKIFFPSSFILPFIIYFSFFLFRFQFNTIRHGIMVSVAWYAFSYIQKKDFRKFLIYMIISGGFHILGLLFIPFYWILGKRNSRLVYIFGIILAFIFGFFTNPFNSILTIIPGGNIFYEKFIFYTEVYYGHDEASLGITLGMAIYASFFLFIVYNNKFFFNQKKNVILINSLFFALFFALLLNKYGVFVERITSMFYVSLIFLIPTFIQNYPMKRETRLIFNLLFVCYLLLLLNKNISAKEKDGEYQYIPFKTIL